jgi:hypothetical protein
MSNILPQEAMTIKLQFGQQQDNSSANSLTIGQQLKPWLGPHNNTDS